MSRLRMYQNDLEKHLKSKRIFHRLYPVLQMQLLLNQRVYHNLLIKIFLLYQPNPSQIFIIRYQL